MHIALRVALGALTCMLAAAVAGPATHGKELADASSPHHSARRLPVLMPWLERSAYSPQDLQALFDAPLDQALDHLQSAAFADPPCAEIPSLERPQTPDVMDALHYDIHLTRLDEATLTAEFTTTVTLRTLTQLTEVELSLAMLSISSVHLALADEALTPVPYQHIDDRLIVQPASPIASDTELRIRVSYGGQPACISRYGIPSGVQFSRIGAHTFSEPTYARHWYPCHDVPWDKALATITLNVPEGREASATGRLTQDAQVDGARQMTWVMDYPVSTYLLAFSFGDYEIMEDVSTSGVRLEHHVPRDQVENARIDFQRIPVMMDLFESLYGPYPFDDYRQSIGWFGGGMEHQGNSLIGTFYLRGNASMEGLFAHELAHQWWGDLVTPSAWSDIWLSEGFATYAEHLYNEHVNGWDSMRARIAFIDSVYFHNDRIVDHPLTQPETERIFSFIVYNKGGRLLDMLRGIARFAEMQGSPRPPEDWADARERGDQRFFSIFPDYGSRHAYANVSSSDFQAVVEDRYGQSMDWFFTPWRDDVGYPELRYDWLEDASGGDTQLRVRVEQVQTVGPLFTMPVQMRYHATDGRVLDEVRTLSGQRTEWVVTLPSGSWTVEPDPEDLLLDQHSRGSLFSTLKGLVAAPNPSAQGFRFRAVLEGEASERATLEIYDSQGRVVIQRDLGYQPAGSVDLPWDGKLSTGQRAPAGVYFAKLTVGLAIETRRLVVVHE